MAAIPCSDLAASPGATLWVELSITACYEQTNSYICKASNHPRFSTSFCYTVNDKIRSCLRNKAGTLSDREDYKTLKMSSFNFECNKVIMFRNICYFRDTVHINPHIWYLLKTFLNVKPPNVIGLWILL